VEQYRTDATYAAVGMQGLVNAIRETGSRHLLLLGGVQYSNSLSQWLAYKPSDPLDNLAAAWHVYDFNRCSKSDCWENEAGAVALEFPIVATEIGQSDCEGETFLTPLMQFLDDRQSGYLAWTWNEGEGCTPREPGGREDGSWSLVTSLACPEPNSGYARIFRDHLLGAAP
jgi:hypothetical protein